MKFLPCVFAFLYALCGASVGAGTPRIIVFLADDLGYADVGFNGCKDIPTPHIDSLAKHGVRCTNGYVSHPFFDVATHDLVKIESA